PDGKTLAVNRTGGTLDLWDVPSGKRRLKLGEPAAAGPLGVVHLFSQHPTELTFSPDGKTLAFCDRASVRLLDVAAGREDKGGGVTALAFSPDGKTLAVHSAQPRAVRLWDVATGKPLKVLEEEPQPPRPNVVRIADAVGVRTEQVTFSPDGKLLAARDRHNQLC